MRLGALLLSVAGAIAAEQVVAQEVPIPPPPPDLQLSATPPPSNGPMTVDRAVRELGLDWSLRSGWWSRDHNLEQLDNVGAATAWLRSRMQLGSGISARFEGWISDQRIGHGSNFRGELREGTVNALFEPFEIRVGRQIVVWGRADRINPTDAISSRDFTLLFPEDDDQRRGNAMVEARWGRGGYTVSMLWLPEFRPNRYPSGGQNSGVFVLGEHAPTDVAQFGVRIDRGGGVVDWSLSYFDGLDRDPRFAVVGLAPTGITVGRRYDRIRQFGADAATSVGEYGLRGEIAYTFSPDAAGLDSRRSGVYLVGGGDRTFNDRLNVNVQYIYRYVAGYRDPELVADPVQQALALRNAAISNQRFRHQHGMSARISYRWPGDRVETELTALFNATAHDGVIRGRVIYKLTDLLRLTIGGDWFFGDDDTYLGEFRRNSGGFVEMRYGF